uniref:Uncharacterized protein n=1 Tax=Schistosoma curassoni TaxID=6186 RepID=A0A183JJ81_9TREM
MQHVNQKLSEVYHLLVLWYEDWNISIIEQMIVIMV